MGRVTEIRPLTVRTVSLKCSSTFASSGDWVGASGTLSNSQRRDRLFCKSSGTAEVTARAEELPFEMGPATLIPKGWR